MTTTIVESTDDLARLVRARREELGITQETLANLSGLDRSFVGMFERGTRTGSFGLVLKLVHTLGMDIEVRPRGR
jgi:transcriptional regulator with XRE-family HTH domain